MCQVKRRSFLSLSATILGGGLIADKTAHSLQNGGQDAPAGVHHHVHAVSVMTETANRFLAALSSEQRAKATFQFSDDERMNWHFIPKERKGLPLREMSPYQRHLASALLAAGLSQTGYIKAVTIMSLEDVLKALENDKGERRNPEKYHFTSVRHAFRYGNLGLPRGRTSPEPELHRGERPGGGCAELLRFQPRRSATGAAQGTADVGRRGRPGLRGDSCAE